MDKLGRCPFCRAEAIISSNRDWHHLIVRDHHHNNCILDTNIATVPATDLDLKWLKDGWADGSVNSPPKGSDDGNK